MAYRLTASVVALAAVLSSAAVAEEFTYSSYLPAGHAVHTEAMEPFFDRVREASGGRVDYKIFSGGSMGGPREMLSVVRDGLVDSSIIIDAYVASDLPTAMLPTSLSILGREPLAMAGAANEFHLTRCENCLEERTRNKIIGLAFYSTAPYYLMCTKPISSLEDLRGARVRATSVMADLMQALGATPVTIVNSEAADAMRNGQIDCAALYLSAMESEGLGEVVSHILDLPLGTYHGGMGYNISLDRWEGMDEDQRKAVNDNLAGLAADLTLAFVNESEVARTKAEGRGVETLEPDQALMDALEVVRGKERARVLQLNANLPIENPEAVLATFEELVSEWEERVGGKQIDRDVFAQMLEENVYSRR